MPSKLLLGQLRARRAVMAAHGRVSKPKAKIPAARWPNAARLGYVMQLGKVVAELERLVRVRWLPKVPALLQQSAHAQARLHTDAVAAGSVDAFDPVVLVAEIEEAFALNVMARGVGEEVAEHNKTELNKQFKAGLGFDLLQSEPYLAEQLDLFAADNVRLVKKLTAESAEELRGIIVRGVRTGADLKSVQEQIAERLDITGRRAALIARDQVGSVNAELTQLRHTRAGVTEYEWQTARDERVRPGHAALHGTVQKYAEPPVENPRTGATGNPGEPVNCRCVGVPRLAELADQLTSSAA
jgi:SPP1 gp7 family putative phage head morphogenesis protein